MCNKGIFEGVLVYVMLSLTPAAFAQNVQLISPDSAAIDVDQLNITFIWASHPTFDNTYFFELADDPTFDSIFYSGYRFDTSAYIGQILMDETTLYWRVMAMNENYDKIDTSYVWFFTTDNPYPEPILIEPPDMATEISQPVVFYWGSVPGVLLYYIQVSDNPDFSGALSVDYYHDDTTYTGADFGVGTTYFWRVCNQNPITYQLEQWSEVWSFTTDCPPPEAPQPLLPPNGTIYLDIDKVDFSWTSVGGNIDHYIIEYWGTGPYGSFSLDQLVHTPYYSNNYEVWPGTEGYWRVHAYDIDCGYGEWSETWTFSIDCYTPEAPILISPPLGATDQSAPVTLSWEALPNVIEYQVQVDNHAGFLTPEMDDPTTLTDHQVLGLSEGVEYFWRVRADYDNDCGYGEWSQLGYFSIQCPQLAAPVQTGPENGTAGIMMPFYLSWAEMPELALYQLQIDNNTDFTSTEINDQLSSNSYLVTGLSLSVPYWWRIRALDDCGWGSWTDGWSFTPGASYTGGDTNCDGQANVGDAVYLINYVFRSGPAPCTPIH